MTLIFNNQDIFNLIDEFRFGDQKYWKNKFTNDIIKNNFLYGDTNLIVDDKRINKKINTKLSIINEIVKNFMRNLKNDINEINLVIKNRKFDGEKFDEYVVKIKVNCNKSHVGLLKILLKSINTFSSCHYDYISGGTGPIYNPNRVQIEDWELNYRFIVKS